MKTFELGISRQGISNVVKTTLSATSQSNARLLAESIFPGCQICYCREK